MPTANQIDATPNAMKNEFGLAMPRLASCRHTDHPPSAMNRNPETCGRRGKNHPAAASSAHQITNPANPIEPRTGRTWNLEPGTWNFGTSLCRRFRRERFRLYGQLVDTLP